MLRTCCAQKLFLTIRTISVHNMFSPCSAKRRASDKDLPVGLLVFSFDRDLKTRPVNDDLLIQMKHGQPQSMWRWPSFVFRESFSSPNFSYMMIRDRPRFFDQVGHQTTNASIGNKYFFTK